MASSILSSPIETPWSLLSITLPHKTLTNRKLKDGDFTPIVRNLKVKDVEGSTGRNWGVVNKLAVSQGREDGEMVCPPILLKCERVD